MNMHLKYDNMYMNGINYALNYTNNHVISSINCMLLVFVGLIDKSVPRIIFIIMSLNFIDDV